MRIGLIAAALFAVSGAPAALADPTVADAAHALEKKWLQLKDEASEERTVSFESIDAGQPNGDSYPFRVTATVRDYDAGYPPNSYYGSTCTMRFNGEVFTLRPDAFGGYEVEGRMNVFDDKRCEDNPSEGASSIPAESVPGQPASAFGQAGSAEPLRAEDRKVTTGPWTCYGHDLTILFGFELDASGGYGMNDETGSYDYDRSAAVITFSGGPLAGQTGTAMDGHAFQLTDTVSCEARS
jgi:hypothetical protein